jgi:anti-sigma regulatory factor (Ser/Thr protein kinase)
MIEKPLTFQAVDDIAFAARMNRLLISSADMKFVSGDLGPLIEFIQYGRAGLLSAPDKTLWLKLGEARAFHIALAKGLPQWLCPTSRALGFFRTSKVFPEDEASWINFKLRTQQAAIGAGFNRGIARQLVAAMGEMHDNIYEHSHAPHTGLVAFKANHESFEFVISDYGIGVLESLRTCPEYSSIMDHGDALRLALTEGVSRHGKESGHGNGFRPLFVGLSNLNGFLRFRSGNHALTIDGSNLNLMASKVAEKPYLKGFIASILCYKDPIPSKIT